MGKPELTYKQYVTLLLSAAATYDSANDPKSRKAARPDSHAGVYLADSQSINVHEHYEPYYNEDSEFVNNSDSGSHQYKFYDAYNVGIDNESHLDTTLTHMTQQSNRPLSTSRPSYGN